MATQNNFIRKICVVALVALSGIGTAYAAPQTGFHQNTPDTSKVYEEAFDYPLDLEEDEIDEALLAELLGDMDEEFDESTLDWDSLLAEEVVDNEGEAESLFGAKAEVTESGDPLYGIDVKLLPLNETVYSHLKESRDWTRQVKVATSQKSQQPVILGNVWSRSVQKETHPTGIDVHTKRATIREGEAKIATSEAAVKERDTIEFGLPKEDDHPIDDATLDYWSRSQVFTPVEQEPREPFRMASEDEIEPFDHEAGSVNYHVYQHQQHAHETPGDLIAQAEISPQNNNAPKKSGTVDGKNKQAQKTPPQNQPATQADQAPPADQQPPSEQVRQADKQKPADATTPPPASAPQQESPQNEDLIETDQPKKGSEEVVKEPPEQPAGPPTYLIKFNNVKMSEYIGFVSKITGKNFVFDPADLNFNVTIVSNEPTTIQNIISALLQELRFRGLNMVEVGNSIIIHRTLDITSPAEVIPEGQTAPADVEIVTKVYRIQNADPDTVATIIRPMMTGSAVIEPITETGHLIVTGLRSNIERITELIDNIDSPDAGLEIGQYQAQNLPVTRAISIADELIAPIAKERPVVLVPLTDRNVVYIVTTPALMDQIVKIFKKIDANEELPVTRFDRDERGRPILRKEFIEDEEERRRREELEKARARLAPTGGIIGSVEATKFYIHKLQYRKGDQIQQALQAVAQSLQDFNEANEDIDLITTINSVQWIESTNSLIFTGTAQTLEKMKELIDELDTALPQVLIEVLVLEATLQDTLSFGVDWGTRFRDLNSAGSQAFLGENSSLPAALDSTIPTVSLNAANLARTAGFNLGVIGRWVTRGTCDFSSIGAIVSAVHTDQKIDVLLNPRIVVEDNTTAEFFVGINTPFLTQSIANEFGNIITGNFEFRDIGSTIKITPLIGNNGIVTLDIEQEISNVIATNQLLLGGTTGTATTVTTDGEIVPIDEGGGTGATDIGPTTRKSTTRTRVHMPDGYFLILSGQIRDEKEYTQTQIPCIGGFPWIGALFSQKDNRLDKRNLMIFIRPQIVDIERINPITKRQQDIYNEYNRQKKRWEYEVDEALYWFNVKEPYCAPEDRRIR